jgi:hypothetical protein
VQREAATEHVCLRGVERNGQNKKDNATVLNGTSPMSVHCETACYLQNDLAKTTHKIQVNSQEPQNPKKKFDVCVRAGARCHQTEKLRYTHKKLQPLSLNLLATHYTTRVHDMPAKTALVQTHARVNPIQWLSLTTCMFPNKLARANKNDVGADCPYARRERTIFKF